MAYLGFRSPGNVQHKLPVYGRRCTELIVGRPRPTQTHGSFCYRGWREVQRYIAEGPAHLVAQHGRDFATGAALLSAVVAGAPIGDVPAFIAARTDGGGGGSGDSGGAAEGGGEIAAGGPCVSPGAVELLLREVAALPLNQVLGMSLRISCCTALMLKTSKADFVMTYIQKQADD